MNQTQNLNMYAQHQTAQMYPGYASMQAHGLAQAVPKAPTVSQSVTTGGNTALTAGYTTGSTQGYQPVEGIPAQNYTGGAQMSGNVVQTNTHTVSVIQPGGVQTIGGPAQAHMSTQPGMQAPTQVHVQPQPAQQVYGAPNTHPHQPTQEQQPQSQQQQPQGQTSTVVGPNGRPSSAWKQPSIHSVMRPLARIQHHKSNSTSSIFMTSNITCPRILELITSVATMLHCQMMRDRENAVANPSARNKFMYFNEEVYTGAAPATDIPSVQDIYLFLKGVFDVGQFHPECCVIALVYINRLIGVTGMPLTPSNWKPVTISSLVIAQKVWDDTPLINADFSILYPPLNVKDINFLERKLLELLEFKLTVSPSLYAQYFFELRSICEDSITFVANPNIQFNRALEQRMHLTEQYQKRKKEYKKMTMTAENLIVSQRRYIIG